MSIQALGWAFDQKEISSGKKFVLIALANYAGDTGLAYPSVHTICELTQQHDETVRKALADLVTEKVIKDTGKRVGATQQVKVYRLPEETWKTKTPENRSLTEGAVKASRKPRQRPGKDPEKAGANLKPETVNQEPKQEATAVSAPSRVFSDAWCSAFQEKFGDKYPYNGRDGKSAAEMLARGEDPIALVEVAKRAWGVTEDKYHWKCFHKSQRVWDFAAALPEIRIELARGNGGQQPLGDRSAHHAEERAKYNSTF